MVLIFVYPILLIVLFYHSILMYLHHLLLTVSILLLLLLFRLLLVLLIIIIIYIIILHCMIIRHLHHLILCIGLYYCLLLILLMHGCNHPFDLMLLILCSMLWLPNCVNSLLLSLLSIVRIMNEFMLLLLLFAHHSYSLILQTHMNQGIQFIMYQK